MSAEADRCFICEKHASTGRSSGGMIFDDGVVYAGHTLPVRAPDVPLGYLMVEPRRHVAGLGQLTDDEAARIGMVTNRLAAALRDGEGAEHVYSFVFGDRVPHLHVHLAPRYPGTPPELRGAGAVGLHDWAGGRRGDVDDLAALCRRLRAALGEA